MGYDPHPSIKAPHRSLKAARPWHSQNSVWKKNKDVLFTTFQSDRCDVAQSRHRRRQQDSLAFTGRFQMVQKVTAGHVIVMGRKTFDSIGKPLPGRTTIVLSRTSRSIPGVRVISDLQEIESSGGEGNIFICGGAQVYEEALPLCSDLYLTLVKQEVHGDVFFPRFEDLFHPVREILDCSQFRITHYRNRTLGYPLDQESK